MWTQCRDPSHTDHAQFVEVVVALLLDRGIWNRSTQGFLRKRCAPALWSRRKHETNDALALMCCHSQRKCRRRTNTRTPALVSKQPPDVVSPNAFDFEIAEETHTRTLRHHALGGARRCRVPLSRGVSLIRVCLNDGARHMGRCTRPHDMPNSESVAHGRGGLPIIREASSTMVGGTLEVRGGPKLGFPDRGCAWLPIGETLAGGRP